MPSIPDSFSVNIEYANLRQIDLNLLVALDVLITEASVTKAAERLNMSQSAMSYPSFMTLRSNVNFSWAESTHPR